MNNTCAQCGKTFQGPPSDKSKYCSSACYWESKRVRINLVCANCGKEFQTIPSEIEKAKAKGAEVKYCSRACWRQRNRGSNNPAWKGGDLTVTCAGCNKTFTRPRTWPKGKAFYCSIKCRGVHQSKERASNWQGGITSEQDLIRKGTAYKEWRNQVFSRDSYTCQECGKYGGKLHAHHIKPFATHKQERLNVDNGTTLCVACHSKHHPQIKAIVYRQDMK